MRGFFSPFQVQFPTKRMANDRFRAYKCSPPSWPLHTLWMYSLLPCKGRGFVQCNEWGKPTTRYKWTNWVWQITGSNQRLHDTYQSILGILKTIPQSNQENGKMSTCNRLVLETLGSLSICPKIYISPDTSAMCRLFRSHLLFSTWNVSSNLLGCSVHGEFWPWLRCGPRVLYLSFGGGGL